MKNIKYILILFCLFTIVSCSKIQYVPVETIKTEYINVHTVDTVMQNSTIYIKEKGDTVYIFKEKEVYKYKNRIDTLVVTDTINIIKYIDKVKYVEVNKIKDWQSFLMILGGGFILILIYKLYNKFKK